jgi:hypothetical protein
MSNTKNGPGEPTGEGTGGDEQYVERERAGRADRRGAGGARRRPEAMSDTGNENGPGEPTGERTGGARRGLLQRLKTWQAAVVAVGAMVALVASLLDVKDRLFADDPPLAGRSASFSQVGFTQQNASRHAYCRDQLEGEPLKDCLAGPNSVGNLFNVGIELRGYEGVCCRLEWTLMNVGTGEVPDQFDQILAVPDIEVRNPLGDIATYSIFVPNPALVGDYRVHFVLADRDGVIKEADSKVFHVR